MENTDISGLTTEGATVEVAIGPPYAPSFVDRLMDLIRRLPAPYWLTLSVLFVLQAALVHLLAWLDGWLPAPNLSPLLLLFPLWLWAPLGIMIYLNATALDVLSDFRPLLDVDDRVVSSLKREFTTMPARGVLLSMLFWLMVYASLTYGAFDTFYVGYALGPVSTAVVLLEGLVAFSVGSAIWYHSVRQLRLVTRTVQMVEHVNLFHLEPAYAFSRLTARTGVAWMALLSATVLVYPIDIATAPVLGMLVLQALLALAAFVLPLRFVNRLIAAEKRRLIAEQGGRVERTLDRLHRALDAGELDGIDRLNDAVAALSAERDILKGIPTWPWRAGTFTTLLSAVGLPILLFVVQLVVERWLGG